MIDRLIIAVGVALLLTTCRAQRQEWPADLRLANLDAPTAIDHADSIVLASVLGQRDLRELPTNWQGGATPKTLVEVEVSLKVLQVLKGPPLPAEIQFRFYDGRGYTFIVGPPKGPSGPIGSSGIFFLRRRADGVFRSEVDISRPDIGTPWLKRPLPNEACSSPRACIADLLLTYREPDDAPGFAYSLLITGGIVDRLVGFLRTFDLLNLLATNDRNPEAVRRGACRELAVSFALELPRACSGLIGDASNLADISERAAVNRESLRKGGLASVRHLIGSDNQADIKRYLHILEQSPDQETREVARSLLTEIRRGKLQ